MLKMMANLLKGIPGKKIVQNNTGIKYSELLIDLITPYQSSPTNIDIDELEYLLDMGVAAWNMAVYKKKEKMMYESYSKAVMGEIDGESKKLIEKMIIDKEKKYPDADSILDDFEIKEDENGGCYINVISKPFDSFVEETVLDAFANPGTDDDDEIDDLFDADGDLPEYVLPDIDRNAVTIKPKQPFFDWLRAIYFPEQPPEEKPENSVYLLKETETEKSATNYLKKNFDKIFCCELWNYEMNEDKWPKNRTYKIFTQWFEVSTHAMVYDLEKTKIKKYD